MASGTIKVPQGQLYSEMVAPTSTSFPANVATSVSYSIAKTGYNPLFVVPCWSQSSNLVWAAAKMEDATTATGILRNVSSAAVTAQPRILVVYERI